MFLIKNFLSKGGRKMVLFKDIVFWTVVAFFYLYFGYQYAKLSHKIFENWRKNDDNLVCSSIVRLIVFPNNSHSLIGSDVEATWYFITQDYSWKKYAIFCMFFWPLKIIFSSLVIFSAIITGILCIAYWIIFSMVRDLSLLVRSALK